MITIGTTNFNFPTITPNMSADVPRDINALSIAVDMELAKKYTKPSSGVPLSDLASVVQTALSGNLKIADKANQSEATTGTNDTKYMTPLRVNNVTGTLSSLETTNKSNLVAAINETFTQVVNGKNAIATAINDRGGSASGSDTFQQLADKIDGLVPEYSSGTASALTSTLTFYYQDSSSFSRPFITVSGLSFTPSRIVLVTGASDKYITEYNAQFDTLSSSSVRVYSINNASATLPSRNFRLDGTSAYVNATGFRLPVEVGGNTYRWYAYE